MKLFELFSALGFLIGIVSCQTSTETPGGEMKEFTDDSPADTISDVSSVLILEAGIDGPDADFYIFSENILEIPFGVEEIHLIPAISYTGADSSTYDEFMLGLVSSGFRIWDNLLSTYSGHVKVFYDAKRTKLAIDYTMVEGGIPNGPVKVYDQDGKLIIHRVYENDVCVQSIKDVYAIDWTFNPKTTILTIQNIDKYTKKENGKRTISLSESMVDDEGDFKNSLYQLVQKPVFEKDFIINGEAFSGTLIGYFPMSSFELSPYFVMNFENGKLHGIVEMYDSWMGLVLEERFENGELVETIFEADESEMDGMAKPVIYLYPEETISVSVKLNLKGQMTHSYPAYTNEGWNVVATPNGTLYDANKKEYYALFWEGMNHQPFNYSSGFVIKGNETAEFLENSLEILGLNRREANEFIMFWLPQMENNPYNLIHFSTQEYEETAELLVTPKPQTLIRIMMVWSPLNSPIEIPQQNLYDMKKSRKGFTVVEWGGKKQLIQSL